MTDISLTQTAEFTKSCGVFKRKTRNGHKDGAFGENIVLKKTFLHAAEYKCNKTILQKAVKNG